MQPPILTHRMPGTNVFSLARRLSSALLVFACALGLFSGVADAETDIYVADNAYGYVYKYTANLTAPTAAASNLMQPVGLAFDVAGNLYTGDSGSGTVYKSTPDGTRTVFASGFNKVLGLAFDQGGNLFVAVYDPGAASGSIVKITPAGAKSNFATGLTRPRGLAFDGTGNLYQADLDSGSIYRYSPTGERQTFATGFNSPTGLAFDGSGNLFVCSQGVAVYKVTPTGVVSTFTSQVTDPRYCAFDSKGNLYVTDVGDASGAAGEGNVYEFAPDGTKSIYANNLAAPLGIAVGPHPAFFNGQVLLGSGTYYLGFANGNYFGYYGYLSDPRYVYHFDLGYEYIFDANDGHSGVYLYDFTSGTFFYTSPTFAFPYLYDFSLNSVVYYYPDPNNAGHYNTNGYRFFYRFDNGQIIIK